MITEQWVREHSTEQSFARGQNYYHNGAVIDTSRRGDTLEGSCEGSEISPYHIRVVRDSTGIRSASCTCPYEFGGFCKHVVALLLKYIHEPNAFPSLPVLVETLQQRSKNDLITLIQKMVERYPDLQALVDRPAPGKRQTALDISGFRKELRRAFRDYEGWGDMTAVGAISSIMETASEFAEQGEWANASLIYRTIMDECIEVEDYAFDDEGEFGEAIDEVLEKLGECLEQPEIAGTASERQAILQSLLSVYLWDIHLGGYGMSDAAPDLVLRHARPEDISILREQVLQAQQDGSRAWAANAYGELLMDLDALDHIDPEVTLQRLRDQGLYRLVFEKLISMGRIEEAVAIIEEHLSTPIELVQSFSALTAAGHLDMAIGLARKRLDAKFDLHLADWLLEAYRAKGDRQACFDLLLRRMQTLPSVRYYAELKETAQALENWTPVRQDILNALDQQRQYELLARLYVHDEIWNAAWEALAQVSTSHSNPWETARLELEVAQASRHALPEKAIPVYVKYARQQINQRNRKNYAVAASYLAVVRELYMQLNNEAAWNKLIAGVRAEFRNLPALQDELRQARL